MTNINTQFKKGFVPWNKGKKGAQACSEATRRKMRLSQLGRKHSKKTKAKIALWHLGRKKAPPSQETRRKMSIAQRNRPSFSQETRQKMSQAMKGKNRRPCLEETRKKISIANRGKRPTIETRLKMSIVQRGEKGPGWRGGVSKENDILRQSSRFRLWRESVFVRDNWTCKKYGARGGRLHPHHIQNFSQYPELRFAIDNGVTLSEKAHREFHKIYGKKNNTKEQLDQFLNSN